MSHHVQVSVSLRPALGEGAPPRPPTLLDRLKTFLAGLVIAAIAAAVLIVALVLGSMIVAVVGIVVIAAIAILIVRGTIRRVRL